MPEAADADKERSPDTTPASDEKPGDAGTAATETSPKETGGVGDMALQKKAEVGRADDPAEKEADAVAQRIMRATETPEGSGASEPVPAPKPDDGAEGAEPVRRKTAPGADPSSAEGGELPDSVRDYLATSKGGGSPLPEATRKFFESKFDGADFSGVRVHDDPGANEAARQIGAVAFTRGADVYFASAMYDPVSEAGRAILAHELTHVVQQGGAGRAPTPATPGAGGGGASGAGPQGGEGAVTPDTPNVVRRTNGSTPSAAAQAAGPKQDRVSVDTGVVDVAKNEVELTKLPVPSFKESFIGANVGKQIRPDSKGRDTKQSDVWRKNTIANVTTAVNDHLKTLLGGRAVDPQAVYYLKQSTQAARYVIGTPEDIAEATWRPRWDKTGKPNTFQVDHKVDYQLGGHDETPKGNLWLLPAYVNMPLGPKQAGWINKAIGDVIAAAKPQLTKPPPDLGTVRSTWKIWLKGVKGEAMGSPPVWEEGDMKNPALTKPMSLVPDPDKLKGKEDELSVFSRKFGGAHMLLSTKSPKSPSKVFQITAVTSKGKSQGGQINGVLFPKHPKIAPKTVAPEIKPMKGIDYGGHVEAKPSELGVMFSGLSPVVPVDVELDPARGLVGSAQIQSPSIPIVRDTVFGVAFDGEKIEAFAVISGGQLKLPGPFQVTGGMIEVKAGNKGVGVKGEVNFEIKNLATGKLWGAAGGAERDGFALGGELKFDTKMFTKAELGVTYDSEKGFGVTGELAVGPDKVKGIKSASAKVAIEGEKISAAGSFEASLKGLEKGTLSFVYDPTNGIEIAGQIGIGKLPGIESATVDAKVKQGADGYSLSGGVTAKPSIPGVTGTVTGKYEDGAFLAEADLGYSKGMLQGKVHLGVTNQAVTGGKAGGPPTDKLTTWGGGEVTIKLAPWLQGTIGLELDPTGKLTVKGRVGLPSELNLFDEKKVEKKIFSIGIDIPIVGVSVAGQRIGIFATIRGGLDASAGFGPGKLRDLSLEVTYSPDDEAATKVTGKAEVFVPAHAGLKLYVQGGVGVGIPIVSATVGLEVSGALGLEGAAKAGVEVNWTPSKGLVLDAKGEIYVEPKFKFSIDGFVDVHADLLFTTIDIYKKKWNFAAFEYGSNLRFGVKFPVHYEEGKPFELSLSNIEFVYPTIDTTALMKGLIKQIA